MQINTIFYENEYDNAYKFIEMSNFTTMIKEIKADEKGRRFQIVETPQPTAKELAQIEVNNLRTWFDTYYSQHEQKYRRLRTLNRLTDEGKDPYEELILLYSEAEIKRARIQELERLLSDSSK